MYKKLTTIFLSIIMFFMFYKECSSDYYLEENSFYTGSPLIEKIIPAHGEQNIISKPEIKIYYSDLYNIDLKSLKLLVNYEDVTSKAIITSNYISYIPSTKFKRGVQVVKLQICDSSQKNNFSTLEWFFTVGSPKFNHYNGVFFDKVNSPNVQTSYSDMYDIARYSNKLNFLCINENNSNNNKVNFIQNKKYNKLVEAENTHNVTDQFTALSSFEFNSNHSNNKTASLNIYNSTKPFTIKDNLNIDTIYKNLFYNEDNIIGQFRYDENFNNMDYLKYSPYGDSIITLFQLNKVYNKESKRYELFTESYIDALDKGWHVAPIINEYYDSSTFNLNTEFRTIALCENLSKHDLIDALQSRRVYVSEDKNIKVDFSINRMPMGSIIETREKLKFIISAVDNDEIDKITNIKIYTNESQLVESRDFNSNYARIDFSIDPPDKNTYYYLVITESSNKKTITAPIWIESN